MSAPGKHDLIDRVDEHNKVVGTVPRGLAITENIGFRVAHVLVVDEAGEVLLQQIGSEGTRSPGRWGSSVAGYLYAGEDPLKGAQRRMREEIGLETELEPCGRTKMSDEGSTKFIYVYLSRADSARVVDPGHVAALCYWPMAEVDRALKEEPDVFTQTFPHVLEVAKGAGL